jgi:hypothetical protein
MMVPLACIHACMYMYWDLKCKSRFKCKLIHACMCLYMYPDFQVQAHACMDGPAGEPELDMQVQAYICMGELVAWATGCLCLCKHFMSPSYAAIKSTILKVSPGLHAQLPL